MNYYQSWNEWVKQVMKHIQDQQQTIEQLTQKIEQLQTQEHPKTVIEKIEYHFDQLKIETLEGTLQIGLTPNGMDTGNIEDLYTPQSSAPKHDQALDELMNGVVPQDIDNYAAEHGIPLANQHREQIIADINKQLPERFNFYRNQHPDLDSVSIVEKLQQEVRHSVTQYFTHKGGEQE
ncbi:spore germination protein GerPC [Halobacillus shinanisalinarum]|uniref:Spore germination protein GerPC n=1 Tax=Halobacillus shinanisalinarum TaxID=2932258 RepID=A0ABY4H1E1_9BACI|nr:spore germination protein GerPC [Halobacillus shinanisalinarum]UOQ92797.1 spore germination protein GerPC [Halobacillus shinanisalinarum]